MIETLLLMGLIVYMAKEISSAPKRAKAVVRSYPVPEEPVERNHPFSCKYLEDK